MWLAALPPAPAFWHSVAEDALTLAGADLQELMGVEHSAR